MEFTTTNKTFVKSSNSIKYIYKNYTYSLIAILAITIILYLVFGYQDLVLPLLKSELLSLTIASIISYIFNIIKKDYNFLNIYIKDNTHLIAIIIGLWAINTNIIILSIAIFISLIIKKIYQGINISAALYGLLIITLYKYFTVNSINDFITIRAPLISTELLGDNIKLVPYLIGIKYLSPVVALLGFIYLFNKKSIKYNIFISYILTFIFIMLIYGIIKDMSLWFILYEITYGNFLFCSVYLLNDYCITPTLAEGQILYGMTLGIVTAILSFIIPSIATIITLILGPLFLTKVFDNISPRLKYDKKKYNIAFIIGIVMIVITTTILLIAF